MKTLYTADISHKGDTYRVVLEREARDDDWDVHVERKTMTDRGTPTWKVAVNGIYGYCLDLSEYSPDGKDPEISDDLFEELHEACDEVIQEEDTEDGYDEDEDDDDEDDDDDDDDE